MQPFIVEGKNNTRDIFPQIPHPFMTKVLKVLKRLISVEQQKSSFYSFNHSNPILDTESEATKNV